MKERRRPPLGQRAEAGVDKVQKLRLEFKYSKTSNLRIQKKKNDMNVSEAFTSEKTGPAEVGPKWEQKGRREGGRRGPGWPRGG